MFPDGHVAELSSPINPSLSIYLRRNTRKHCKEHSENIYAMWHYKTHAPSSIFNTALEYNNIREHKTYWKKSSVLVLFLLLTSHHVCLLGARYGYGSIIVDTSNSKVYNNKKHRNRRLGRRGDQSKWDFRNLPSEYSHQSSRVENIFISRNPRWIKSGL